MKSPDLPGWTQAGSGGRLLEVRDLTISFPDRDRAHVVVERANLSLRRGETLGIVGESGAGKTAIVRAVMRLLPSSAVVSGSVRFDGRELLDLSEREMRSYRGSEISMVFQDPLRSLNPTMRIGRQITEALTTHASLGRRAANRRAVELLDLVGLADPAAQLKALPHQLAAVDRQRVIVAIAISCNPKLIIADEAGASLDLAAGTEIVTLLRDLQRELGLAMIVIGHDLSLLVAPTDQVIVLCGGQIVETGTAATLRAHARVPYTRSLLDSSPVLARPNGQSMTERSSTLRQPGQIGVRFPPPYSPRSGQRARGGQRRIAELAADERGCAFAPRCAYGGLHCREAAPPLKEYEFGHDWACWFPLPDPSSALQS